MGFRDLYRKKRADSAAGSASAEDPIRHNDTKVVHNQAGVQNHYGPTYHGPVYHGSVHVGNIEQARQTLSPDGIDIQSVLDEEIIRTLAFPEMLARRGDVESPHPDTCQWILQIDNYQAWTERPSGLLWIKGNPGAGKSVMMAYLYKALKRHRQTRNEVQLDFFFSARGAQLQHDPLGMIRALLIQLFNQDASIRPRIRDAFTEKRAAFGGGGAWEWQRRELEHLFAETVLMVACRRQICVFVDALDEAGDQSAKGIATYLHQINDQAAACSAALKICISSRHYPVPTVVPGVEIMVEKNNGNDILKYIHDRFIFHKTRTSEDEEAWLKLKADLIKRAAGIFQWVCLVIRLIEGYVTEGYSPKEIQQSLREVPQELNDVYGYIMRNVIKKRHICLSYSLFQWVCLAERPFSVAEMRYALAADCTSTSPKLVKCDGVSDFIASDRLAKLRIISLSGGLVEVNEESDTGSEDKDLLRGWRTSSGVVQVIHQSVNDFLLENGLELMSQLADQAPPQLSTADLRNRESDIVKHGHGKIFRSCLNYLIVEVSSEPRVLNCVQNPSLATRDFEAQLPLLKYVINYLFVHAKKIVSQDDRYPTEVVTSLRSVLDVWRHCDRYYNTYDTAANTTLLHVAVLFNDTRLIQHLLTMGAKVDTRDSLDDTALHVAARLGSQASAEVLLNARADINARGRFNQTPLEACIGLSEPSFAQMLLNRGADVNSVNKASCATPLYEAARQGHFEIVECLISAGANVNAWTEGRGTALQVASSFGRLKVVDALIKAGADVNLHTQLVAAPLNTAAESGVLTIVSRLIDSGAKINAQGGIYGTALQVASCVGARDVCMALIRNGADVNLQGGLYGTVLQAWAAANWASGGRDLHDLQLQIIGDALIRSNADVNIKGGIFGSALQAAACTANSRALKILMENGADVNMEHCGGETALMSAAASGIKDNIQALLINGANISVTETGGLMPLHYGARAGSIAATEVLMKKSFYMPMGKCTYVDRTDGLGRTPLHLAFIHGHIEEAWTLMSHWEADCTILDVFGRVALDYVFSDRLIPSGLQFFLINRRSSVKSFQATPVQQYVCRIAQDLLRTTPRTTLWRLYDLIHCIIQLSSPDIVWPFANMLLRLQIHRSSTLPPVAVCSMCSRSFGMFNDPWLVCQRCPFFDLCSDCNLSRSAGKRPSWGCNHEVFEIKRPQSNDGNPALYDWFGLFTHDSLNFELLDFGDSSIAHLCRGDD